MAVLSWAVVGSFLAAGKGRRKLLSSFGVSQALSNRSVMKMSIIGIGEGRYQDSFILCMAKIRLISSCLACLKGWEILSSILDFKGITIIRRYAHDLCGH